MWRLCWLFVGCVNPVAAVEPIEEVAVQTDVGGDWSGALEIPGGSLRVVFHLDGAEGTMDSPDQGAFGLALDGVKTDGNAVEIVASSFGARFTGTLNGERIEGTWAQGGASLPLVLVRGVVEGPKRPQMPKEPFPYDAEEVSIPSGDGVVLAGTLTRPRGKGPFRTAILLSGSGAQDRDESLMGHKPFLVLADHLSRAGIAVLRLDDRGVGSSTGDFATATTFDFAVDASHALAWIRVNDRKGTVGFIGHSEGGLVGPLAHQTAPADFLVLLAGPAVSGREIVLEQGYRLNIAAGMDLSAAEQNRALSAAVFDRLLLGPKNLQSDLDLLLADMPKAQRRAMIAQVSSPWFSTFLSHDPQKSLRALDVPVLALFGERDLQVVPAQNAPVMKTLLRKGTVEILPGLNHLFQPAETGLPAEYVQIETTMSEVVLDRVGDWILQL